MIWFSCKQCGKTHGRPETSTGATIFCACGTGLIVPWESTVPEPPMTEVLEDVPPALKLEPVTFEPVASNAQALPPPLPGKARKRTRPGRRDPQYCFNHQDRSKKIACADCGEGFCDSCLIHFAGSDLCGPCKNYRVKNLQRPVPFTNRALFCLIGTLLTGPVTLALWPVGRQGFSWWSVLAFMPQLALVALALLAWRDAEKDPKNTGRAFALTGLVSAAVVSVLIVLLTIYTPRQWI